MGNIGHIITKNIKLLVRSRTSALIIIVAPLILIILLGLAFDNSNAFGLTIGVYSPSGQSPANFLKALTDKQFRIIEYKNETNCIEEIKVGLSNTCIILPTNLNVESNDKKTITFHIDQSKINLVWMIMDTLNAQFSSNAREMSKNLVGILIAKLEESKTELQAKKPIVAQIKTDAGEARAKVQTVVNGLAALDFSYNDNAFPIGEVKQKVAAISTSLNINLQSAQDNITTAKSNVNTSVVVNALNSAIASIDSAKASISATDQPSLTEVGTLLTVIQNGLTQTKSKLTQANTFKEGSNPALKEAQQRLDQSLQNIGQVENTINKLLGDINSIKVTNPEAIAEPIVTQIKPINTKSTYLNYIFPSLIVLVVMFISIMLGTTLVMMEKNSPAYFRNFIAPTSNLTFIIGTYLTTILLVAIQLVIILIIASSLFSTNVIHSIANVAGILALVATFFTFWGMGIGYIFTSEETSTLGAISTGSLFLLLSSVIIPLESMPMAVRQIANFNPFVIGEKLLRQVIIFQPKFEVIAQDLGILLLYSVGVFIAIIASQKFISKRYLQRILYYHHKKKREEMRQRELEHLAATEIKKEEVESVKSKGKTPAPLVKAAAGTKWMLEEKRRLLQEEKARIIAKKSKMRKK